MERHTNKANLVLVMGLIGMVSVLLTIISDFILIGRPISANAFLKLGTKSMEEIAQGRITFGAFFGVVVLPFQTLGLIPIYYGLKPSGKLLPLIMVITTAHALLMGVAFHIAYAFIGTGWIIHYKMDANNLLVIEMVKQFDDYWKILVTIMLIEILMSSIIYTITILNGRSLYPKWMAIINPIVILIIMFPLIFVLPAPIGGFIAPAYLNISTMVFFGLSAVTIYRKLKYQENNNLLV